MTQWRPHVAGSFIHLGGAVKAVNPYLNFAGDTEQAFRFYQSVFGGELRIVRFKDLGAMEGAPPLSEEDQNKIGHIALPLGANTVLMGTDALEAFGQKLVKGNNTYITIETDSAAETEELFSKLSAGGKVEMPLMETDWAEKYGSFVDRFGVQWQLSYTGRK